MTTYYMLVLLCALAGFAALAISMEKYSRALTGRMLGATRRRYIYWLGWGFLIVALGVGVAGWHWNIGPVLLLGSLTAAGTLLVFIMPWWPLQPKHAARKEKPVSPFPDMRLAKPVRGLLVLSLIALPIWVGFNAWKMSEQAVLREDAIHGQIGPWTFVLAEENQDGPEFVAGHTPIKQFHLRFCEACDSEIRAAYLKIRKPRSLRAAGLAFQGARWTREVAIYIPPAARLADQIWLTVESKSGEVYQQAFDIQRLSPATARFIQEQP
ncbi:Protein of unknown function [Methylophilus rhizosphaerae]|uniref:DUF3325 domain-containing protein n=1 Tax=Methylophilus rhizosphaerae TaxID=492660 RepID=A0A1G9BP74_9PROT|nr:DUF3325 domain-containing protein [Methylophilus rhizosphaerae]SDK41246.1 Protein of unknown function [Methylophilus rhizosphaerae]